MDVGTIRGLGTLALFLSFVVYCLWAWAPSQRRRFHEASMLPFLDDDAVSSKQDGGRQAR